jgi:membrane-associated phospholipid phosphatase
MLGEAAAFAALSVLVAAGALTPLDQWAIDHAMAGGHGAGTPPTLADALVPLLHAGLGTPLGVIASIVTVPASLLLSLLLVGGCCLALRRRGQRRAAYAWAAAWLAGNAIEELCKSTLTRPALYRHGLHLVAFDSSFPSGHTIRTVLVAAAVAAAWPAGRLWAAAWAAASLVLIEVDAMHTPSDIAGGLLVAGLLVAAARRAARV